MEINYAKVGERIREIRLRKGITQEKLAELADISPQHMNRIENATRKTTMEAIYRIAEGLSVDVELLLFEPENRKEIDYHAEMKKILDDCNEYERHILAELMVNTKQSIRKNKQYL